MELKIGDANVGSVYFNIKLEKTALSAPLSEITSKLKNKEYTFTLDTAKVVINSYRKIYTTETDIFIEGAVLKFI